MSHKTKRYGLVWPGHRSDIHDKDIVDFAMTTKSTLLPPGSGILVDVKDIHGRVFFPTSSSFFRTSQERIGFSGFFEIQHYAAKYGHELFFGVPVLQDSTLAGSNFAMINASGKRDERFICPQNPEFPKILIELLFDLTEIAPAANIFLPFFRYPVRRLPSGTSPPSFSIPEIQACCFCRHCRKGFKERYGYDLDWSKISTTAGPFFDWLDWRCFTIETLARCITNELTHRKVVLEIDLCPKRFYFDGLYIDNGHNIEMLSRIFKHILIHLFDRSSPLPARLPTQDINNDVVMLNINKIRRNSTPYSMMWNITDETDLKAALQLSDSLDVEIRFFVLYPELVPVLVDWLC